MSVPRAILFVEDNVSFRSILSDQLVSGGEFTVSEAGSVAESEQMLIAKNGLYDTILLDVGLPDSDGCEFCAKLRELGHQMPIIMLTGAGAEQDVVRGLNAGANDYIAKPFRYAELLARIQAQLRIFDNSDSAVFIIGSFQFHPFDKVLFNSTTKKKVWLTEIENKLLKFLCKLKGKSVTRSVLLADVWGYNSSVNSHTMDTHIYRLRQKIEIDPANPKFLKNEKGVYRLDTTSGD